MLVKGTIGLGIRERKPVATPDKYSPDIIEEWLSNLPKANIGETSKQVYSLLNDSNKELLSPEQRSALLGQLQETVALIAEVMKKHYMGMSVSLSEKQQKIANFVQALDVEMAIGYKTIVEDLIADEKYQSKILVTAVNYCMHYLFHVQRRCYLLYRDLPKGMWHEIHLLYQLSEQNQFHEQKLLHANRAISIVGSYKRILLLSTANPNKLRQHEIELISNMFTMVSQMTQLDSDPTESHDFIVNLSSDTGPFHSSLLKSSMTARYRGISLDRAKAQIEQQLNNEIPEQSMFKIDEFTLNHLLGAWGEMATRTFARVDGEGMLEISIGMTATHHVISELLYDDEDIEAELSGDQLIESLEGSLKDAVILEPNDEAYLSQPAESAQEQSDPGTIMSKPTRGRLGHADEQNDEPYKFIEQSKVDEPSADNTQQAAVINISPGGFCLELGSPLPKQTQAGEIIGLMEHGSDEHITWNIGAIRWMRRKKSGELDIGVQLIAPNAKPVRAQLRNSHSNDNLYQRCLLLPAIKGIGQPETLLTSPLPFREQAKVRIKSHKGTHDVLLVSQIDSGLSYKQFTYKILDTELEGDMKDNHDDFDLVWKIM